MPAVRLHVHFVRIILCGWLNYYLGRIVGLGSHFPHSHSRRRLLIWFAVVFSRCIRWLLPYRDTYRSHLFDAVYNILRTEIRQIEVAQILLFVYRARHDRKQNSLHDSEQQQKKMYSHCVIDTHNHPPPTWRAHDEQNWINKRSKSGKIRKYARPRALQWIVNCVCSLFRRRWRFPFMADKH